ncbi:hypothetical protein KKC13_04220 [bacterium]|nr:hypothetical protein [bacterium]
MASKKPPIKNEILADYLISSSHDLKSIGGLLVSGVISTFGVYSVIKPFFEGVSTLNTALIAFVMVLIIFDTIKRGALTKFFNSLLKKKIIGSKPKKGYLVISVFATIFMVLLDGLGSWSTAEKGADLYTQFKTNSSTEYQILQQNAETGKATAQNYTIELSAWQQSKADAQQTCNEKWNGWKAKYKAQCKEEWNTANPMPTQTADGQIKIDDYQSIKNDRQGFLDEYLFIILFTLLLLMTLLMQYLTIAKIYDDYNEIEEGLTFERIEFINDTIQEHETILSEHEQQVAEMMANSTREKKGQDRKFQEVGEAIAITHKKKMVETRGKTVKRIANNVYVPKEESKAGFAYNPFGDEGNNQSVKPNGYNQTVKPNEEKEPIKEDNNQSVNQTVITEQLTDRLDSSLFNGLEMELIGLLWAEGEVKQHDALLTRKEALGIIGDTKINTNLLRDLYKKLLEYDYIYKRVGYFAKVEL